MEYYSLKMRASQQVGEGEQKHEQHISGAERIVGRDSVEAVCSAMVRRAMTHSKGDPDFVNVKIEKVCESDIQILKALPVTRVDVETWQEGLEKAFGLINKTVSDGLLRGARNDAKRPLNYFLSIFANSAFTSANALESALQASMASPALGSE